MVTKWRRPCIASPAPPPAKTEAPVSARKPCNRLSPSAPTIQTIGLELSSSAVAIGAPRPLMSPHQAVEILGAGCASILSTVRPADETRLGQLLPEPSNATRDPFCVGMHAGAARIELRAPRSTARA